MDHETLHVGNVCKQAKDFQAVDELEGFGLAALDVEGENGTASVGEILLVKFMIRMVRQARMAHAGNLRVLHQVLDDLLGVFYMAVQAERKGFYTLQQQECVERRNGSAFVTQENRADVDGIGCSAGGHERNAVARVLFGKLRELATGRPVELATIYDDAAEGRSMAADKLGGRMHHHVGTVFDGANQVGRTEGVVDDQRDLVLVGDCCDSVDIRDVGMGVAEGLDKDEFRVFLDGGLDALEIVGIYKRGLDTEGAERVLQQVESTAVNRALDNHVISTAGKSRDGVSDGCSTRSYSQSGNAAFESGNAFFEHALRCVRDTAINVTGILQGKTVSGMLCVMEHVRRGLVNRNGTRIGCGVCLFLANVELKSFKMELVLCCHGKNSF